MSGLITEITVKSKSKGWRQEQVECIVPEKIRRESIFNLQDYAKK